MKPLAKHDFRVDYRHKLRVFVWPNKEAMVKAAKKCVHANHETGAYFHGPRLKLGVYRTGRTVVLTEVVGEMHFNIQEFDAGIFAHELQHFISRWSDVNLWNAGAQESKQWEKVSYLVGDLTNAFWSWFYRRFRARE